MATPDDAAANKENLFNNNASSRNPDSHDGAFTRKNNLNNVRTNPESRREGLENSDGNLPSLREVDIFNMII
jgi:hypothetical protein